MSACRSCGASILWGVTVASRPMPLDPEPRADGNVVMTGRRVGPSPEVEVLTAQPALGDEPDLRPRYVAHFVTCPNADEHRKGRK